LKTSSAFMNQQNRFRLALQAGLGGHLPAVLVLLFTSILIVLREPRYFFQPRFWAEEGARHFAFSYHHGWLAALFQPQVGYLNFWPNLATRLAVLAPLERAPLVTTLLALLVQVLIIALILWSRSSLWNRWDRKLLGVAVVLFSPLSAEVWLNTINSYTFFAAITFFILLEETPRRAPRFWLYNILLVLGGLSGTLSSFLLPLFIFRAFIEKDKQRWLQVLLLGICALIHVVLIISVQTEANFGERFHLIGLTTLGITIWTQSIAFFAFGPEQAYEWARIFFSMTTNDLAGFQMWGRMLLVAQIILFILLSANLSWMNRLLFLGGYAILLVLPMMFSIISDKYTLIDTGLHQRIFFAPNILLGWMLVQGICFSVEKHRLTVFRNLVSLLCVLLVSASLLWGIKSYQEPWFVTVYWPDWTTEVQTWKQNPEHKLQIQPEGWEIELQAPP
jgi:hypothetical protein